jgi:hypothetical protein
MTCVHNGGVRHGKIEAYANHDRNAPNNHDIFDLILIDLHPPVNEREDRADNSQNPQPNVTALENLYEHQDPANQGHQPNDAHESKNNHTRLL